MSTPVCVLTTAWNQADKTIACLDSVVGQEWPNFSILLVDNASQDETVSLVASHFPQAEILSMPRNLGFAGGYNAGLRHALSQGFELVLLINNDTILASDCLNQLVKEATKAADVGMVTAKIYYADDQNRIWTVGSQLSNWTLEQVDKGDNQLDTGQWQEPQDIEFAPLCGVLLKRQLLEQVGLLDEGFFLYYEDMDFCRRARLSGFRLRLAPAAKMWHAVASSSGGSDTAAERYWMAQSSGRYFRKHAFGWRMFIVIPYRLGSGIKTTIRLLVKKKTRALAAYWYGLVMGWATGRADIPPPHWVSAK